MIVEQNKMPKHATNCIIDLCLLVIKLDHACILGCVRKRRSVRSDRSDRGKTRSVNGRNVGGVWSDGPHSVRKCVGSVGRFDRSPNTDRSIFISIDVNKRSRRCHTDLEKGLQQLQTPSSRAADVRKSAERSDRSDTTFRTLGQFHTVLYRSV
jgi:hypothetical protein